jgi:hypothetical protein
VAEEKKDRRPLREAVAARTDGLDIIAEMEREEREAREERPAGRPADTFGGILQSMVPLLILPQILPLFQQSLGQTLSSTTVNVRVESATALIPISVEAATAIVPIEIRASQVTLNVNIASQTTTLNVTISGDAFVIISGQNVGVALTGTWQTFLGYNKVFWAEGQLPGNPGLNAKFSNTLLQYTVPTDRELYIESVNFNIISRFTLFWSNVYGSGVSYIIEYLGDPQADFFIYVGNTVVTKIALNGGAPSLVYQPVTPLKIPGGTTVKIIGVSSVYGCWSSITVLGYEKVV